MKLNRWIGILLITALAIAQTAQNAVLQKSLAVCSDLSNAAASCSTDATNASNLSSGTVPAARLPNPSASTLGGIQSYVAVTNQWIDSISTSGAPGSTQPGFSNLSGSLATSQLPATVVGGFYNSMSTAVVTGGGTSYFAFGADINNTSEGSVFTISPWTGTLKNLYVETKNGQPSTGSLVCTIMVGTSPTGSSGSATSIAVTFNASTGSGGTFQQQSDLTNTAAIAISNTITLRCVNNASTNSMNLISAAIQVVF
jgi:hypothetical protein